MTHSGHLIGVWPTGCPVPPEDPAKLHGPEVGAFMLYRAGTPDEKIVEVIERSYVWSPGECRHNGGYRNYGWSVVEDDRGRVVVNDTDLSPIPEDRRARIIAALT